MPHESFDHVAAHAAKTDHRELHFEFLWVRSVFLSVCFGGDRIVKAAAAHADGAECRGNNFEMVF